MRGLAWLPPGWGDAHERGLAIAVTITVPIPGVGLGALADIAITVAAGVSVVTLDDRHQAVRAEVGRLHIGRIAKHGDVRRRAIERTLGLTNTDRYQPSLRNDLRKRDLAQR